MAELKGGVKDKIQQFNKFFTEAKGEKHAAANENNCIDHVKSEGATTKDDEQQCTILSTATTPNYEEDNWYSSDKTEWHDHSAEGKKIIVLYDYTSQREGEINIKEGQTGIQTEEDDDGWSYGQIEDSFGKFPTNYVKLCEEETLSGKLEKALFERKQKKTTLPVVLPKPKKQPPDLVTSVPAILPKPKRPPSTEISLGKSHTDEKTPTLEGSLITESVDRIYDQLLEELRIVMVGKTGAGKSATGNSILGKVAFESKISGQSVTKKCQYGESVVNGRNLRIVDTPGLFDTKISAEEINQEILNCVQVSVPGPHIFLLILQIARFTDEEINTFNRIFEIFGDNMGKFSIILFTKVDDLIAEGKSVDTYITETGPPLTTFLKKCNGHYFAINNKAPKHVKTPKWKSFCP